MDLLETKILLRKTILTAKRKHRCMPLQIIEAKKEKCRQINMCLCKYCIHAYIIVCTYLLIN